MPDSITVQTRIVSIEESNFFIREPYLEEAVVKKDLGFAVAPTFQFDPATHTTLVRIEVNLVQREKPDIKHPFLHYIGTIRFEVYGFEMFSQDDELPSMPLEIGERLVATAYATVRGIIYMRCYGSTLRHAILPMVDPETLLTQQEKFMGTIKPSANIVTEE